MTSLKNLQDLGAFVGDKPLKKEITFKVDDVENTATIHVRRLSTGDYESLLLSEEKGRSRTAEIIQQCIRLGEEGEEALTYEQAYNLLPAVGAAMVNAFNEVNAAKKS